MGASRTDGGGGGSQSGGGGGGGLLGGEGAGGKEGGGVPAGGGGGGESCGSGAFGGVGVFSDSAVVSVAESSDMSLDVGDEGTGASRLIPSSTFPPKTCKTSSPSSKVSWSFATDDFSS